MTIIGIAIIGVVYIIIGGLIAEVVVENHYNMESAIVETVLCLLLWPVIVLGMAIMKQLREKRKD